MVVSVHQEDESDATIDSTGVAVEPPVMNQLECRPDVPRISDMANRTTSFRSKEE